MLWAAAVGTADIVQNGAPAVAGSLVYVGTATGSVYAIHTSGGIDWTTPTGAAIRGNPVAANGTVFVVNANGLYALNATTGTNLWHHADTAITTPVAAVADGRVYVGDSKDFYSLNAADGVTALTVPLSSWGPASGQMMFANNRIFLATSYTSTTAPYILAFGAFSGDNPWSYTTQAIPSVASVSAVADGIVYGDTSNRFLYAFDARTGVILWSAGAETQGSESISAANGVLYVDPAVSEASLLALDAQSGAVLWSADNNGTGGIGTPVIADGMLYVAGADKVLYAYALNAGNNDVYHRNPKPPALSSLHPNLSLSPWHRAKLPAEQE